ncbi:alpha/beta hydrolase [Streptacidiphilus sp. PB12-B1b]|uniref:alpha/beta hydrolase n=1 Tax=Streptacidiphilus sp. PB12-B1b TaxID=2705012 RepID=UPI0015FB3E38|nr:alpha/beta hydrolase [Streptacidiphilus sp. PB12-B1b]QMU77227.1 alpha/beta hydrolase [Streptacidiphilus sp. PB12-B1b]
MTINPEVIHVPADDGIDLHTWLYRPPQATGPVPVISMAHGFGGMKYHGLDGYAQRFAAAGFAVVIHDHRGFGLSGGQPRRDVDPWRQLHDWRRVISFLTTLQGIDPDRIGLWGTSYAGGHSIVLGASDRRIKAVVSQIPTISGYEQALRRVPVERRPALAAILADDDRAQLHTEPATQLINSLDPTAVAVYHSEEIEEFDKRFPTPDGIEDGQRVTLRSTLKAQMYEPGLWIPRVAPTPLLMIVATRDVITPHDLAENAFETAGQPNELVTYDGGHFDAYTKNFDETSGAALDWFREHV